MNWLIIIMSLLFVYWEILLAFLSSADFFFKIIPSECQIVWILIRPNDFFGSDLVQTVCKGYQQTKSQLTKEKLMQTK